MVVLHDFSVSLRPLGTPALSHDLDFKPKCINLPAINEQATCSPEETSASYSELEKFPLISLDLFEAAFFTSQTIWDLMCFFKNDLNPLQRGHCNDAECTFSGQFAAPSHHHRVKSQCI